MVYLRAVEGVIGTVIEVIGAIHQTDGPNPIKNLLGPVKIGLVARVRSQASTKVEKGSVGDAVFVVVAVVEGENLPSQPAAARRSVPTRGLVIKHGLRERQPLRLIRWRIGKSEFCGRHGSHAPEALVVISLVFCLIRRHEVLVGANLPQKGLRREIIVRVIAGVVPVVDQRAEKRSRFPPKVRSWQDAGDLAAFVATVVLDHAPRNCRRRLLD